MKKNLATILLCAATILLFQSLSAQNNLLQNQNIKPDKDSLNRNNDSLNAHILDDYTKKLAFIEKQRIDDSVKKAALETRLNSLKTTDNLQKEDLQKQLEELNNKNAIRITQKKAQIDALRQTAKAYPIRGFFSDTLFLIYSKLGSFSAKDRADAISNCINKLADNFNFKPDSLQIFQSETTNDILFDESIIMSISENDALWNTSTVDETAKEYKRLIGEAVVHYKSETSLTTLIKEIGLALLVLLIIGSIIYYLLRFFAWIALKTTEQEGKTIKVIEIKNYTLFNAKRRISVLLSVNPFLKWVIIVLTMYITLPILFGIFLWTKNFAETLFGYVLNPIKHIVAAFWQYLPNLITIIVIVYIFCYVLKGIYFIKTEIEKEHLQISEFYPDWTNPTYQIVKVLVFAFMVVVIFPYLPGSNSPVFQGVSVFLGFLFTFDSAGSLSNAIAGLVLTYSEANKQAIIYSNLHQNIQDVCNEILSPHYRVAREGNMITIPTHYLDKDYKTLSFNIK